ncbi:MAG: DUF192 domain-containing protein [Acidimicrobiales bacterium]
MPWIIRDGEVLATLEVATSMWQRTRGLLGRDCIDGALLLRHTRSVHTLGMRFAIDVAYCDADLVVRSVATMVPWRVGLPRPRSRCVLEASAGAFERWQLQPGDQLEVKGL